jgi:hypothetical protein
MLSLVDVYCEKSHPVDRLSSPYFGFIQLRHLEQVDTNIHGFRLFMHEIREEEEDNEEPFCVSCPC